MKVVVRIGGHERDLDLVLRNPEATLGQLLEAVTGRRTLGHVHVGDRPWPASAGLLDAGVHAGAVVGPQPSPSSLPPEGLQLVVTGGLDAGLRVPLTLPTTTVGRSDVADVAPPSRGLSRRHLSILRGEDGRLRVRDEGSRSGTLLDGRPVPSTGSPLPGPGAVVLAGGVALAVRDERTADRPVGADPACRPGPGGTVPFDPPPRSAALPSPGPVSLPVRRPPSAGVRISPVALLGPLVLAALAVAGTGDLRAAVLVALSPVLGLGDHLRQRRRADRADRKSGADFDAALARLQSALDDVADTERARRRELCPDPAELLRRAALPTARLWERRAADPDFLTLHAGVADLDWTPPVVGESGEPVGPTGPGGLSEPGVRAALARPRLLSAPVAVELAGGGVVGVVGNRSAALAVARSLLCQAAAQSGPADLGIGVFVDPGRETEWAWAKWLPHTRRSRDGDDDDRWVSADHERSVALLRALRGSTGAPGLLVVLDGDVVTGSGSGPLADLLGADRPAVGRGQEARPQVAVIVLADSEDRLPVEATTVVLVGDDGEAVVRHPSGQVPRTVAAGLSVDRAQACARDLARFDDARLAGTGTGLPARVRLLPLLERIDVDAVQRRWRAAADEQGISTPIGVTASGVFTLDLVRDGPHAVVGGWGAGEFLRTLVAGIAARHAPTRLTFLLIDVRGEGAFDDCARLPHTVGTVRGLDAALADRTLRALEAELRDRQRLFAAAGVSDHAAYVATRPAEPLPRLVLVVDEVGGLAEDLPDVLAGLVRLATIGNSAGVHLVLGTGRPDGAPGQDALPATDLRVALRSPSPQSAGAVTGQDHAGRADITRGHELVPVQTALVSCTTPGRADAPVEVRPFLFGPAADPAKQARTAGAAPTDLERLVDAVVSAWVDTGAPHLGRSWSQALGARAEVAPDADQAEVRPQDPVAADPGRQGR